MTLDQLTPGESGTVIDFQATETIKHKLMTMGIVKGTRLTYLGAAPFGDPIKVNLRGYTLSLRLSEAKSIRLKP